MVIFTFPSRLRKALLCQALLTGLFTSPLALGVEGDVMSSADPSPAMEKFKTFTNRASEVALQAIGLLGIRYKYGGNSPESGLDCSGLVRHVFHQAWGMILPRTSEEISQVGKHVESDDLRPGDLVFYNTLRRGFSHVGIYLGENKFIHAPSAGGKVRIERMDVGYWKSRFNGARRIHDPEQN